VLLNVLNGVALGALLHDCSVAIVLFFALPTAFALLGYAVQPVADWLDTSTTFNWLLQGQWSRHTPQILASAIVWVAIPLAAGIVRTVRREIK
jgi:ABC-2 type transport system permease protein